jgi:UDP-2,4-diacetamido-2,4,6-trideoxy-beta-L-altropyranose hydrolase
VSAPRILFIANAGPEVGGGHVMRSLTLARALAARGASCSFASSPAVDAILDTFGPEMAREPATSLDPESLCDALTGVAFEGIVFDHYGLARNEHASLSRGRASLVIDDLADRPLGADLVLDSGPERQPMEYQLLVEEDTRLLLGPDFAPVRPEFAALRDQVLARRSLGGPVRRILVALGLTDAGGLTARVVDRLRPRLGQAMLDVVVGSAAPSLVALGKIAQRDDRLTLHVDTPDMARLMAEADIGIGAAGSTVWERCVLGLPSANIIVAENQRAAAAALAARAAALVVDAGDADFDTQIDRALVRLTTDSHLRAQLTHAAAQVCDGRGADRVAEAFLGVISRRGARTQDLPFQA